MQTALELNEQMRQKNSQKFQAIKSTLQCMNNTYTQKHVYMHKCESVSVCVCMHICIFVILL